MQFPASDPAEPPTLPDGTRPGPVPPFGPNPVPHDPKDDPVPEPDGPAEDPDFPPERQPFPSD